MKIIEISSVLETRAAENRNVKTETEYRDDASTIRIGRVEAKRAPFGGKFSMPARKRIRKENYAVESVSNGLRVLSNSGVLSADDSNLLFGKFKLGLLCSLLGVSISQILEVTGLSLDSWRSYESGRRKLPNNLKLAIEDFVKEEFSKICL